MDNENVESVTDSGLMLGYSGYRVMRRTSDDFGAGSSKEKPIQERKMHTSSSTFSDLNTKVSDTDNSDKPAWDIDNIRLCHEPQIDNGNSFRGMFPGIHFYT
ncbi:hypothetical protein V6N13_060698 [Hibiscus sabdariffa]|uniref:Uncharacterized protein n=1 Tax=Hibiscus sabdariffa TaxID=183260 RepID=A0ABR2P6Y1_9ROSI